MAYVDDDEGWRRLIDSLAAWSWMIDGASEGMRTHQRDGLVYTVTPAVPDRSLVNDVVYRDGDALRAAYDEIDALYRDAGIEAWTVWVPDRDPRTAEWLAARGHVLDGDPEAMVVDLDGVERPPEPPGFDADADPAIIGPLNDLAYGHEGFERALALLGPRDGMHVYGAGDGEPQACVVAFDAGDDCGIWFVATVPEARGRGLSGALMGHALADARERGRTTSTLQASDMGRPVYERVGYRSIGEIGLYERRYADAG